MFARSRILFTAAAFAGVMMAAPAFAAFSDGSQTAPKKNVVVGEQFAAMVQCMTDDGYGRKRPCSALYKKQNPSWRSGSECMTDDGYGRMRPCSALYKKKKKK